MIDFDTRLTVFHDDNGTFSDHTDDAMDYSRDFFSVTFVASEDKIYLGYRKPVNTAYVEMETANTNTSVISVKYYNGTSFTAVPRFIDKTKGFSRSGFLTWDRNLDDEAKTTVNSVEAYWYQLTMDSNPSDPITFRGINIVFSDDTDLRSIVPGILQDKFIASGEKSHILAHVAARDAIIQKLRNSGRFKVNINTGNYRDINIFDVLDVAQLREASKFKALAVIYGDLVDGPDDFRINKMQEFESIYQQSVKTYFLNLDVDDDGLEDKGEELLDSIPRLFRR